MKTPFKRGFSFILALMMVVSLLSGLPVHVHAADYSYIEEEGLSVTETTPAASEVVTPTQAPVGAVSEVEEETYPVSATATYTYNWGSRGTVATELSAAAKAFYVAEGTSYEELSALSGATSTSSVPSSALYKALKSLMAGAHDHETSYDETRGLYRYTDCQNGGGKISSFYSGTLIGPDWDGGTTWNREHTWPNSKGLAGNDENDIMMLRPTSVIENSSRGNKAYGKSSNYYNPNGESGGKYDLRGDVSRIVLYVYTRWGNTSYMWGEAGVMESKEVLLEWMEADPVDTWEMGRNDAVQSITGTRNVFVDYPELGFLLFNEEIPAGMTTPSGNTGVSYTITATVNDSSMGSVSVSGTNVTATPNTGYMVAGYELVSGTAEVTREGNTFIVRASSDCTIKIIFAARTQAKVTYMDDGKTTSSTTVYTGDSITLPAYGGTAPKGYSFLGWVDKSVSHETNQPTYYTAGSSYTVTGDVSLHALFSYTKETESGGTGIWTLVTNVNMLAAGKQIVFAANGFGKIAGGMMSGKSVLEAIDVTFSADKKTIPTLPAGAAVFTLGGSTGAWTFKNEDGRLLGASGNKTSLVFGSGTTTWKITISGSDATISSTNASYGTLQYNSGSPRFANYTSSQKAPQIYIMDGSSTTYYTTVSCLHENTRGVTAQAPTCTEDGYTSGVYCDDCESYISGHEVDPQLGHNYVSEVTPPTETEQGYTTYTCDRCGDSYVDDYVPALNNTVTITFSVPVGVTPIVDTICPEEGIELPEAGTPDADYTFLGWTTAKTEDTATKPICYEAGETFTSDTNVTLYALYSHISATGKTAYLLVENASQLVAGSKIVITSSTKNFALSRTQNNNNRGQADITKNADKTLTLTDGVAELTLGAGTKANTWSFYSSTDSVGYLYAASSSNNYLRTKNTLDDNGSFTISIGANGAATVTAQGTYTRNLLRYNSGNKIFSCYGSGQEAVCFYIETPMAATMYTTEIVHTHAGVYNEGTAATCTEDGVKPHYICVCGEKFADSACTQAATDLVLTKLGHDFAANEAQQKYLRTEADCKTPASYYISCSRCALSSKGTDLEDFFFSGTVNPAKHTGETYISGKKDATCTEDGNTGAVHCKGCDKELEAGEVIPAAHKLDPVAAKDATHHNAGQLAHFKCSVCSKLFMDKDAKEEVTAADVEVAQIPHSFGSWKYDKDKHWKECDCGDHGEEAPHEFGAWKTTSAASPEKTGSRERTCKICSYVQKETIPVTNTPATGDVSHIGLWLMLMGFSACALFFLIAIFPKKGKYVR